MYSLGNKLRYMLGLSILATFVLFACGDSPTDTDVTDPDNDEPSNDIRTPERVLLRIGGTEILRATSAEASKAAELVPEGRLGPFTAVFHADDHLGIFFPTDNQTLEAEIADESIARFEQETDGGFEAEMVGVSAGSTTLVLRFLQDGGVLFESAPIPVEVAGDAAAAVFDYDMTDAEIGAVPAGWSNIWGTGDELWEVAELYGARHLSHSATDWVNRAFVYDEVGEAVDVEIVARTMSTSTASSQQRLVARASGDHRSETAYMVDFLGSSIVVLRFVDGDSYSLGAISWDRSPHRWTWVRFRVEGPFLYLKVWEDGDLEPEEWSEVFEDHGIQRPGGAGIGNAGGEGTRYYDQVSIAVGGETATTPASPPTVITQARLKENYRVLAAVGTEPAAEKLSLPAGAELANARVSFHGADGRQFHEHAMSDLEVVFHGADVATWEQDPDDAFMGRFTMDRPGETQVELRYLEGDDVIFASGPITLEAFGTQYFTDFTEHAQGDFPDGWTRSWESTSADNWHVGTVAGRTVLIDAPDHSARQRSLYWTQIGQHQNADILILTRIVDLSNTTHMGILARGLDYETTGMTCQIRQTGLRMRSLENNFGDTHDFYTFTWTINAWYYIRMQVDGTQYRCRTWREGDEEPDEWHVSTGGHIRAGYVGLFRWTYEGDAPVDFFSVATDGALPRRP